MEIKEEKTKEEGQERQIGRQKKRRETCKEEEKEQNGKVFSRTEEGLESEGDTGLSSFSLHNLLHCHFISPLLFIIQSFISA